ncbi:MAG: hypothetical protein CSA26_08400 [Desulfobacterales bacterium]|nr:MAG: hypothetical protein CSA26_08400 [Desulfobacterales bacterium]
MLLIRIFQPKSTELLRCNTQFYANNRIIMSADFTVFLKLYQADNEKPYVLSAMWRCAFYTVFIGCFTGWLLVIFLQVYLPVELCFSLSVF